MEKRAHGLMRRKVVETLQWASGCVFGSSVSACVSEAFSENTPCIACETVNSLVHAIRGIQTRQGSAR